MIIVLNDQLVEAGLVPTDVVISSDGQTIRDRTTNGLKHTQFADGRGVTVRRGLEARDIYHRGFVGAVSAAYSKHYGVAVNPHDIWYVVLTNFSTLIAENPDLFRAFFTNSDEKKQLLVPQGHEYEIDVEGLLSALAGQAPVDPAVLLPEFSTATPGAKLAMAAAVLDAAQHYYNYGMFCCGITKIDLRGTAEDWQKIITAMADIEVKADEAGVSKIGQLKLAKYFSEVRPVIQNIIKSFTEDMTSFWMDFFTQKNVGSGSDLVINGWICDLYRTIQRGDMIKSFHDCISTFPYENVSTKEHFFARHGAFGSDLVNGVFEIRYDHVVMQYTPEEKK